METGSHFTMTAVSVFRAMAIVMASLALARGGMGASHPAGRELAPEVSTPQLSRPIVFYGRLLDQRDEPLSGATIQVDCIEARLLTGVNKGTGTGAPPFEHTVLETVSDSSGGFSFGSIDGKILRFANLKVQGYDVSRANPSIFSADSPTLKENAHGLNPDNPMVFRFWKRGPSAPLARWMKDFRIPIDGSEIRLDLFRGEKVAQGGDLLISLTREPGNILEKPLTWAATFKAVDGGIAPDNREFCREAPESGYLRKYIFGKKARDPEYNVMGLTGFYVKSRRGAHYAHVRIRLSTGGETEAYVSLESYLNPSGSRNLEPGETPAIGVETIREFGWEEALRLNSWHSR